MSIRQKTGKLLLRLFGWKMQGYSIIKEPKAIFVVAPHTSWQDVPLGMAVQMAIGIRIRFLIRREFFFFPLGPLLRLLGGYPVDRSKKNKLVDTVAGIFRTRDSFYMAITPEGTRERVSRFRSGFYYMALATDVPLILTKLNFRDKKVVFSEPWWVSGDKASDFEHIYRYFDAVPGRYPEKSFYYDRQPN